jgi:hypothetical protein
LLMGDFDVYETQISTIRSDLALRWWSCRESNPFRGAGL